VEAFGGGPSPRRRFFVAGAAAVAVLLIGALDYATGPGISLLFFTWSRSAWSSGSRGCSRESRYPFSRPCSCSVSFRTGW